MTRETILNGEVCRLGVDVNKVVEIQDKIYDAEKRIDEQRRILTAMVFGNPGDLFPKDTFERLRYEFDNAFSELEDAIIEKTELGIINLNENLLVDKYKVEEFEDEIKPLEKPDTTFERMLANNESPL